MNRVIFQLAALMNILYIFLRIEGTEGVKLGAWTLNLRRKILTLRRVKAMIPSKIAEGTTRNSYWNKELFGTNIYVCKPKCNS